MSALQIKALKHYAQVLYEVRRLPSVALAHYTKLLENGDSDAS
jgi:hypothetical protein